MANIHVTAAFGDYDQTRDLAQGRIQVPGVDLTVLNFNVEEIFFRFHDRLEWDVSELSMGMYTSARSRGDNRFIAIPVFPSRVFRHSAIYVREGGPIKRVEDLQGKVVGCPQWSQTATIYVRGYIAETVGIPLNKIRWVQAGVNDPGREEPSTLKLPEGIDLKSVPGKSLNDMLIDGEIDAIISARAPKSLTAGDGKIKRLFANARESEAQYFRETGIFPIMHTIAIRRDLYDANRWLARDLFKAFDAAKNASVQRLLDITAAHAPIPWVADLMEECSSLVFPNSDPWPYGVDANRATLESFLRFCADQGTCHRHLSIEEIFAEEALAEIRV